MIVPETYEELREAYLDMAKFYQDEKYDHSITLDQVDLLLNRVGMLTEMSKDLMGDIKTLKGINTSFIQSYFSLSVGKDFLNINNPMGGYSVGLNFNIMFLEKFNVLLFYNTPTQLGVGLGWRLF